MPNASVAPNPLGAHSLEDAEIVLVSYRSRDHVAALLNRWPASLAVAVVDNSGDVDSLSLLTTSRSNLRYLSGGGQGFARAANLGAYSSKKQVVVFVNPDSRPTAEHLAVLVDGLRNDPAAAAHAATMTADGEVEIGVGGWEPSIVRTAVHAFGLHKLLPRAGLYAKPALAEHVTVDWTTGACMAVRREVFVGLGGFDDAFYVYSEDTAYGRRARQAGLHSVLREDVVVPHGAGSSGAPSLEMMRMRGASFANYVLRYDSRPRAAIMRLLLAAGSLLRAGLQWVRGNPAGAAGFAAVARGVLSREAYVDGVEVARARFEQVAGRTSEPAIN